jgi:CheY-like chemotaxis protein
MAKTKTVMIADDEPDVLLSVAQILEASNYRTIKAKDGYECIDKLEEEVPDVLLLDIMMPGLTSKEIISKIEKDSSLAGIKIIWLLASKQVIDFIEKPFTVRRMLDAIGKAIEI